MFKKQFLEASSAFIFFNVILELCYRVSGNIQFEHQFAHFEVDKASHRFDFQAISVHNSNLVYVYVGLRVVSETEKKILIIYGTFALFISTHFRAVL